MIVVQVARDEQFVVRVGDQPRLAASAALLRADPVLAVLDMFGAHVRKVPVHDLGRAPLAGDVRYRGHRRHDERVL